MTRLELCCDPFTKLLLWSKVKQDSCTQQQHDTLSFFFFQSPDSELMNLLAKTTTDYTIRNEEKPNQLVSFYVIKYSQQGKTSFR